MGPIPFAPRALVVAGVLGTLSFLADAGYARASEDPIAPLTEPASATDVADPLPLRRVREVAVTAARSERDVLEVPGNVTVIDREAIERSGVGLIGELLRREAGLFVTNDIGSPEGFTVEARGFNNGGGNGSSLLVMVDGRRVNEADSSQVDWSLIQLDRVERIEIVRGSASALYGDNATAGVVHIVTRRAEGPLGARASTRVGSFDTLTGNLFVEGGAGPWSGTLFLDGYNSDGFRDNSGYRAKSADGSVRFTPGENVVFELSGGYHSDNRKRPGTITDAEIDALGRDAAPNASDDRDRARVRYVQGLLDVALNDALALKIVPYYRSRSDRGGLAGPGFTFDFDDDSSSWGVSTQLEADVEVAGLANRTIAGFDWLREDVDRFSDFTSSGFPPSVSEVRAHRRTEGVFLQDELSLTERTILSGGLRYDRAHYGFPGDTRRFSAWSPKLALTHQMAGPLAVYASFDKGFRFPNFDESIGVFGVGQVKPQRSRTYEIGAKVRGEGLSANLALYVMNVRDEILFNSVTIANENFDRVRHRGIEVSANTRPVEWVEIYGSYTFDDARIRHDSIAGLDGRRIPVTPKNRGTLGVIFDLPYAFEVGANANFVGERRLINDLGNTASMEPGYATVDTHVALRPRIWQRVDVDLLFRVRNLLDKEYNEVSGVSFFSPVIGRNPAPDRNYEVALAVTVRR